LAQPKSDTGEMDALIHALKAQYGELMKTEAPQEAMKT